MKKFILFAGFFLSVFSLSAQDVVPKAKTKEQRKAERKKMTLEEKIEDTLPVKVTLPSARLKLPGNNNISNVEDAKKLIDKASNLDKKAASSLEEAEKYVTETIPNKGKKLKEKARGKAKELKKLQAKVFDGKNYKEIAVAKKTHQVGKGNRARYYEFFVLKEHQKPMSYHRKMSWFEESKKARRFHHNILARDPKTNSLLHGPYKEYLGNNLVKEGHYYLGVKDGRWMEYARDNTIQTFVLTNKETFNKGFYSESLVTFYDGDSTKIKEVTPLLFGKTTGDYYRFFEDGTLAEEGKYDNGKKIDLWIEYYEGGGHRRKKETQYPSDCYDDKPSYVLREYDQNKKVTFEHNKSN